MIHGRIKNNRFAFDATNEAISVLSIRDRISEKMLHSSEFNCSVPQLNSALCHASLSAWMCSSLDSDSIVCSKPEQTIVRSTRQTTNASAQRPKIPRHNRNWNIISVVHFRSVALGPFVPLCIATNKSDSHWPLAYLLAPDRNCLQIWYPFIHRYFNELFFTHSRQNLRQMLPKLV